MMTNPKELLLELQRSGRDVFWQGKASKESIDKLEALVGVRLPTSFRRFLSEYGGGGVVGEEISGIEDDDPTLENRGTVYGDTLRCREDFGLPSDLVVLYLGSDDIVWCLDATRLIDSEYPVVSFDVFTKLTKPIASSFDEFLAEYVRLRLA